ncbi:MAG: hypothetical protein OXF85_03115 [Candidatus Saccharibacteria bacterium]|nr:hypothetical protein [Candidatus Saccharibacteria bacterium]
MNKTPSNKFAAWSLTCSILYLIFIVMMWVLFGVAMYISTPTDASILSLLWIISGLVGVLSMIASTVFAIIGLKRSKQLNGKGKAKATVALSLISIPIVATFLILIPLLLILFVILVDSVVRY